MKSLEDMSNLVDNMYFKNRSGKLGKKPFQSGITVSIKATMDLYRELKEEGLSYLMTSRINQDSLENIFSTLRLMGGSNSHPSSVEAINRIRKLCVIKNVKSVVNNPAVEISDEDSFVTADLFDSVDGDLLDDDYEEEICDVDDEFHEFNSDNNEARNYVAGYIGKKIKT